MDSKNELPLKICTINSMMQILKRDFENEYYQLLGENVRKGMEIDTAIYDCWNKLVVPTLNKLKNGEEIC